MASNRIGNRSFRREPTNQSFSARYGVGWSAPYVQAYDSAATTPTWTPQPSVLHRSWLLPRFSRVVVTHIESPAARRTDPARIVTRTPSTVLEAAVTSAFTTGSSAT